MDSIPWESNVSLAAVAQAFITNWISSVRDGIPGGRTSDTSPIGHRTLMALWMVSPRLQAPRHCACHWLGPPKRALGSRTTAIGSTLPPARTTRQTTRFSLGGTGDPTATSSGTGAHGFVTVLPPWGGIGAKPSAVRPAATSHCHGRVRTSRTGKGHPPGRSVSRQWAVGP